RRGRAPPPGGARDPPAPEPPQEGGGVPDGAPPPPRHFRQPLDQLVAVQRPLTQEQQKRRLDEALHTRANVPVARPGLVPAPDSARVAMSHSSDCMSKTYV